LQLKSSAHQSWTLQLGNPAGGTWQLHFDAPQQHLVVDRSTTRSHDFQSELDNLFVVPRLSAEQALTVTVYLDTHSIEVFADAGLLSITTLVFPDQAWTKLRLIGTATLQAQPFLQPFA
jgi:sucrose-6-phosphate hydrolase SacC (GH32 family)